MSKINITGAEAEVLLVALNYYNSHVDMTSNPIWEEEVRALVYKMAHHYETSQD